MSAHLRSHAGCFSAADLLLPENCDLPRWAVIACDQYTSQPEYWEQVRQLIRGVPSAGHLILPECDLNGDTAEKIRRIQNEMKRYLESGLFREYRNCFVYTERRFPGGQVRCGLIGKIDLERYDYTGMDDAEIRATEETVCERIPPRMAVRRGAPLELPHVLLLCNDDAGQMIGALREKKDTLPKLYDFELMLGGGRVAGWLVEGEDRKVLEASIADYERRERQKHPGKSLLYAVGDGNHSLATAKACWEELKQQHPDEDLSAHPARYALCEMNCIHDPGQRMEPIHRIVKRCHAEKLLSDLKAELNAEAGTEIRWISGENSGTVRVPACGDVLPLAVLQQFLDRWLLCNGGELDYIHGDAALEALGREPGSVGFLLPAIEKESLFPGIISGGVLPRKTFSMGEAEEKRYYLEARRILP